MKRTKDLFEQPWKTYKVPIEGGTLPYYTVKAPNKTMARKIVEGETHPWIHVKGKIIEAKDW